MKNFFEAATIRSIVAISFEIATRPVRKTMSYNVQMPRIASLPVWLGFCAAFLGTAISCLAESVQRSGPTLPANHPAAAIPRVEKPADFPSRWDAANWKAREAAFAKAGMVAVTLTMVPTDEAPRVDLPPQVWCKLLDRKSSDGKQLLFSSWEEFGLSADGKLHCLYVDMPSLGQKEVSIDGHDPNCGGGAYRETVNKSHVYEVPKGVSVGEEKRLSISNYGVMHRYKQSCPPIPGARRD